MSSNKKYQKVDTNFWKAVVSLVESLSNTIKNKLENPVKAYMAGGSAFHFYTMSRVSRDADISFSHRIIIPDGMVEFYYDNEDHTEKSVTIDKTYSNVLGLMHPDYADDSVQVGRVGENLNIDLYVISPVDLAVSKLGRFSERDESDIKILAGMGFFTKEEFINRATEALAYYVGDTSLIEFAIKSISKYMDDLNEYKIKDHEEKGFNP